MPLITQIRRLLSESPDRAYTRTDETLRWGDGTAFLKHPELGVLVGDWSHRDLIAREVRATKSDLNVELALREVEWSGRFWVTHDDDVQPTCYVSMWGSDLSVIDEILEEDILPNCYKLFQSMAMRDDEWVDYAEIERSALASPLSKEETARLQQELHVATPEKKKIIRDLLGGAGSPSSGRRAGGFRTPAERNFAMGA